MASPRHARADLSVGLGIALLSAIIFWDALRLPPPVYDPVGAGGVLKAIAAILFGMAVALAVSGLRRMHSGSRPVAGEGEADGRSPMAVLPLLALLLAYVAAMQWQVLRFQEATVILVLAYSGLMRRPTLRQCLVLVPIALIVGYGGFWLFSRVFLVRLPG